MAGRGAVSRVFRKSVLCLVGLSTLPAFMSRVGRSYVLSFSFNSPYISREVRSCL